jgi:predicted component of type VI protein secretion system
VPGARDGGPAAAGAHVGKALGEPSLDLPPEVVPTSAPPVLDLPQDAAPASVLPRPPSISLDLPPDLAPSEVALPLSFPAGPGAPLAPPQVPHTKIAAAATAADHLLSAFAESYLPASVQVRGAQEIESFLGKLAEAIEAFGRSFVEMRKGYEEFGRQMGVRTVHGDGPIQRARDPRQLLATLLDPAQQGKAMELQGAFADYMVHQVAILNGVVEGAKSIVGRLSPEQIEAISPGGIWPMKAQNLWKTYEARFLELFEEESAISDALFGKEFGKAYSAIVGKRSGGRSPGDREEDDDEEDDDVRPPPRSSGTRGAAGARPRRRR